MPATPREPGRETSMTVAPDQDGDLECPRCKKNYHELAYDHSSKRCLSCDLKWPRPDAVGRTTGDGFA
jgi:hypothetical protein